MKRYYVYMLECSDESFYVGITSDLERRIGEHQIGWNPLCYTHQRRPVKLVYSSDFIHVEQAIAWEKQIKGWSRKKKLALIAGDYGAIQTIVATERKRRERRS